MPIIHDEEFGEITVRRSPHANQIKIKVAPNLTLKASTPMYTPLRLVRYLVNRSRDDLRNLLAESKPDYNYESGMTIGKSHTLIINNINSPALKVTRHGLHIMIDLPNNMNITDKTVVDKIREVTIKALRIEAKSYLPKRLQFLAQKHGYTYDKIRFSHASSRWGSCSSNGVISLNIALMKLPFELIDYIIIHELVHTEQMNHSERFWQLVEKASPDYKSLRKNLKTHSPSV